MSFIGQFALKRKDFNLHLELEPSTAQWTTILGPVGCGKTTLLRLMSGLASATNSRYHYQDTGLKFNQRDPLPSRDCQWVPQHPVFFENWTIERLLQTSAQLPDSQKNGLAKDEIIETLQLQTLLHKTFRQLSGGQIQKVALAQALVARPSLLLLDEPFSAMDQATQQCALELIGRYQTQSQARIYLVSHQVDLGIRLADELIVLENGKLRAQGPPASVWSEVYCESIVSGNFKNYDSTQGLVRYQVSSQLELLIPCDSPASFKKRNFRVRAQDVSVALDQPQKSSILNSWHGVISQIESPHPSSVRLEVDCQGQKLWSQISKYSFDSLRLAAGQKVWVLIKGSALQ